jgi:hypothetical protein
MPNLEAYFPTGIDNFPQPSITNSEDDAGYEHDKLHSGVSLAINRIETRLGISGSTDVNSLDYLSRRAFGPHSYTNYSGAYSVDLNANPYITLFISGDLTISTNSASRPQTTGTVKSVNIRVIGDVTGRYISFASGIRSLGYAPPIGVPTNKAAIVSVSSWGPVETDTIVGVNVEA